jgi:hypothetical protein
VAGRERTGRRAQAGEGPRLPRACPRCRALLGRPPAWLWALEAMSPGSGRAAGFTVSAIAAAAGVSRQGASRAVAGAIEAGLAEPLERLVGAKLYRKTAYGRVLLSKWRRAGWRPAARPLPRPAKGGRPGS